MPAPRSGSQRRRRRSARRLTVLAVLTSAWVLALLALATTGARWVDLAWSPLVLAQSLSPLAVPLCLLGLGAVLLPGPRAGRAVLGGVCVLVLVVHAAIWVPWLTDEPPAAGRSLTVMTVNLLRGRADTEAVSGQVRAHGVDVLVLSELSNGAADRLRADGVDARLPYAVPDGPAADTTVVRSRYRLTPAPSRPGVAAMVSRSPAATLRLGGRTISVRAVHPFPPTPDRVGRWRSGLAELAQWAQRTRGPLLLAGDFNASVDHPGMRELMAHGLRDAHEVAGQGRPPTWPNGKWVPAFVHLDHVLVRGIHVGSAQEVALPGTDHDAVIVDLVVPPQR